MSSNESYEIEPKDAMSAGAKVGIVFFVLILLTILGIGIYLAVMAARKQKETSTGSPPQPPPPPPKQGNPNLNGNGLPPPPPPPPQNPVVPNLNGNGLPPPPPPPPSVEKILGKYEIGSKITLKGDNGLYLARCADCKPEVVVSESTENDLTQWTIGKGSDGKITLQGSNGKYMARCNNCVPGETAKSPDSVFASQESFSAPYEQWTMIDVGEGKIALQADTKNYLARCQGCSPKGNTLQPAFLHVSDYKTAPWAQWTVNVVK